MTVLSAERTAAAGGVILAARFAVGSVVNYAFGLALAWLLVPEAYGVVSVVLAMLLFANVVLSAGFPWAVARRLAAGESSAPVEDIRTALVGNLVVSGALVVALLAARAGGLAPALADSTLLTAAVAATIPVMGLSAVLTGVLQGRRQFAGLGALTIVEIVVRAGAGLVLVLTTGLGAAGIAVGALVGALSACAVAIRATGGLPGRGPTALLRHYRDARTYWLGTVCLAGLISLDVLGLSALGSGSSATSVVIAAYQVCAVVARAGYYAGEALANAVFPYMARESRSTDSHAWFTKAVRWVPLLIVPAELAVILAAGTILRALFPDEYADSEGLLRLLAVGAVGLAVVDLHVKALYSRRRSGTVAGVLSGALGLQVLGLVVLVPLLGAVGAALAHTVASWVAAFALALAYCRSGGHTYAIRRSVLPYTVAVACLTGPAALVDRAPLPLALLLLGVAVSAYAMALWQLPLLTEEDRDRVRAVGCAISGVLGVGGRGKPFWRRPVREPAERRALAPVVAVAGSSLVAVAALFTNLRRSPDSVYDEVVYTEAAQNIVRSWELTWTGQPMLVHPPLSFLAQAAWQTVTGSMNSLADGIVAARLLSAGVGVVNVALLAALAWRFTPAGSPRVRGGLALVTGLLAALDPVLLRYSRLAVIEPFALSASLVLLLAAWSLRHREGATYVVPVGLAGGIALLCKELTVFTLVTPVVFALFRRDAGLVRRTVAAVALAIGVWLLFALWAVQLGASGAFLDAKFGLVQRLLGTMQITGLNQPGVSLVDALLDSAAQYGSSYAMLALGGLALLWLGTRVPSEAGAFVLAWLTTAYAFAGYITAFGTLNEQFFVYVIPASVLGTVLMFDAVLSHLSNASGEARHRLASVAARSLLPLLLIGSEVSWARTYLMANDALLPVVQHIDETLPACAAVNVSGDSEKYRSLLEDQQLTQFATGAAALSHGVHLFLLSPEDAEAGYGEMSPELAQWIRAEGKLLFSRSSQTYGELGLWLVETDPRDPLVDVEQVPGGVFVLTSGSRCGGFSVTNGPTGDFASAYTEIGGKALAGRPLTRQWTDGASSRQVLDGAVLGSTDGGVAALPVVTALAAADPGAYAAAALPPVLPDYARPEDPPEAVLARVDLRFREVWSAPVADSGAPLGEVVDRAAARFGLPLGPASEVSAGLWRQPFSRVVLSQAAGQGDVTLAPLGWAAVAAGTVTPPDEAWRAETPAPLPDNEPPVESADVQPFLRSGILVLVVLLAVALAVEARRMRRPRGEAAGDAPILIASARGAGVATRSDGVPAVGAATPLTRRARTVLLVSTVAVLVLAAGVKSVTARVGEASAPLPDTSWISDQVLVGPRQDDGDLQLLATALPLTALVDLGGPSIVDRAVARYLDVEYVSVRERAADPPAATGDVALEAVEEAVRAGGVVYVYADDTEGPALDDLIDALDADPVPGGGS